MAVLLVAVGEGTDMLLSLSRDKSRLPSFMWQSPSVECCGEQGETRRVGAELVKTDTSHYHTKQADKEAFAAAW